jgi:CheY-like chemotaxis protein
VIRVKEVPLKYFLKFKRMEMIKRILIFDDDESIIDIIKFIMEDKGWEVLTCSHCNDSIFQVRNLEPSIIMMDNNIPEHGGIFAIKSIKQQADLLHIPIIYFTAHRDIQALSEEAGADAYLAKPFDLEKLYELIELLSLQKIADY